METSTLILCCGNPSCGDDALGPALAGWLRARLPAGGPVRMMELAQPDVGLIDRLQRCARLIVVDACRAGAAPGTLFRWSWPQIINSAARTATVSSHGLGIIEVLRLAEQLDQLPPTVIFAVEGDYFDVGAPMSEPVHASLDRLRAALLAELAQEVAAHA